MLRPWHAARLLSAVTLDLGLASAARPPGAEQLVRTKALIFEWQALLSCCSERL